MIKTHNPFVINDINLVQQSAIDVVTINNYGNSLIFGHPQGPAAGRLIAEILEGLAMLGNGNERQVGCSAVDMTAVTVFKVNC